MIGTSLGAKRSLTLALAVITAFSLAVATVSYADYAYAGQSASSKSAPAKPKIKSAKSAKPGCVTIKVKGAKAVKGYQYVVAKNKAFTKGVKKKTSKKAVVTLSKLTQGTKYYVKVRAYKAKSGKKVWSKWSKPKTVTIKRKAAVPAAHTHVYVEDTAAKNQYLIEAQYWDAQVALVKSQIVAANMRGPSLKDMQRAQTDPSYKPIYNAMVQEFRQKIAALERERDLYQSYADEYYALADSAMFCKICGASK